MEKQTKPGAARTSKKVTAKTQTVNAVLERADRRRDAPGRWIAIYAIVGVLRMLGGLYVSTVDAPSWAVHLVAFVGIALRIALAVGVVVLIVWWIQHSPQTRERGAPKFDASSNTSTWRFDMKNRPLFSSVVLIVAIVFFGAGPIGILYFFLIPTTFIASTALLSFFHVSVVLIAVLGIYAGVMVLRFQPEVRAGKPTKASDTLLRLSLPVTFPLLLAMCWLVFVAGPVTYVLHQFADKETRTQTESARAGTAGLYDFMCGGLWTAELMDHSFWWPRRVCNIDLRTHQALRDGGTIELRGRASRFGIDVDTYLLVPR